MKIQIIEASSKRPVANTKIQLQVKGKDSGFLSLTTDATGYLVLDEKYAGQQLMVTHGAAGGAPNQQGQWFTANEGAKLTITTDVKETSHGGSSR